MLATLHHPITVDRDLELEHAETPLQAAHAAALVRVHQDADPGRPPAAAHRHGVARTRSHDIVARPQASTPTACTSCPSASTPSCSGRSPGVDAHPRPAHHHRQSPTSPLKGLRYLLEALAKLRTERDDRRLVVIGRPKEGGRSAQTIDALGLADAVEFVTGVTDERIVELYAEAELAVVPSLYEGFSLPAIEAMACGVPLVATTGGALPEVVGADGETALLVPPGDAEALAAEHPLRARRPRAAGARSARPGRQRVLDRWTWRHTAERTRRAVPRPLLAAPTTAPPRRRADDADRRLRPARPRARRPAARPRLRRRPPRVRGASAGAPASSRSTTPPPS